ncbi:MAG: PQQ-like beta-propeller repeat protein [Planctomycetes bacterium]|nr:PQQ-like beta-propeller repeat protein [Planctomycetota bacterium]
MTGWRIGLGLRLGWASLAMLGALCAAPTASAAKPDPAAEAAKELGFEADDAPHIWPQWRGLGGRGVTVDAKIPDPLPDQATMRWECPLGVGLSSPVVAHSRVFVTDRQGMTERVIAIDANTGKPAWTRDHPVDFDPHMVGRRHGNGPKSTPLVDAESVYSLGIAGWLVCCDAKTGKVRWSADLAAEYGQQQPLPEGRAYVVREEAVIVPTGAGVGAPVPLFGYTGSLVAVENLLICPVGGSRGATVMAFERATGKVVWKSLNDHVSYSSPVVATLAGKRQIVYMTGSRVVGLDPASGNLLWSYPFQLQYDESITTPIVLGNLVVVGGTGAPLTALAIGETGGSFGVKLAWENFDLTSYLSTMSEHEGFLYGLSDGGEFMCVRLTDGATIWSGGKTGYYTTPVRDRDRLLCLTERGTLLGVPARPEAYRNLGRVQLSPNECWTSPAVIGGRIYVRAVGAVRCFEFK